VPDFWLPGLLVRLPFTFIQIIFRLLHCPISYFLLYINIWLFSIFFCFIISLPLHVLVTLLTVLSNLSLSSIRYSPNIFNFIIRGSSVSIVSDHKLETGRSGFDPRQRQKDFSSILCVQVGSEVHPATYQKGSGGSFPADKTQPGRDADHSPPSSSEVMNE
jgi:hypothetical protein